MLIDRRMLRSLDGWLIFASIGLILFGLVAVHSATYNLGAGLFSSYFKRQVMWTVVGLAITTSMLTFDYRYFGRFSRVLYLGSLAALALVAIGGHTSMGAQRWLSLGPLPRVQPSEFVKVALIIALAKHLDQKDELDRWQDLISPLVHMGIPVFLILLQPDLGSTIIFAGITLGMLFVAGIKPAHLLGMVGGGVGLGTLAALASRAGWLPLLKEYQIKRLLVFLNPYAYQHDEGWNIIQSMIAIGSGRFFGKGLFAGSQTQLNFLPSRHTDFIFSVVGEELGFIGAIILLGLYFLFLWRSIQTIAEVDNRFGRLLVAGVFSMFLSHLLINVGMSLGVMPVTGKPLPFISYGGSSALANYMALGILLNVNIRRRKIHF